MTSIVILAFNKLEYTKLCIESIRTYTRLNSYEIIVVDNNSTDGTREWLLGQEDIIAILNDDNVGFPAGCNQGMKVASGSEILLLNNDIIVTKNWLELLLESLYSDDNIGAVGPVTNNSSYYQAIPVAYRTIDEMQEFARSHNHSDSSQWEYRLKLIGFCFLVKKEVVDKVGALDEVFTPGNFEDDDYSFRILEAGFQLILNRNVFIHHFGSISWKDGNNEFANLLSNNKQKFYNKWGFDAWSSTIIHYELIEQMKFDGHHGKVNVLQVGCGCGGTLLQIKNKYQSANLYGIEPNSYAAKMASQYANIEVNKLDLLPDYQTNYFDYIILGNVIEKMVDPWTYLQKLSSYLADSGVIIANMVNVMHFSVIKNLIQGRWMYGEMGILDKNNLRHFTLFEIDRLFRDAGYSSISYSAVNANASIEDEEWINYISKISGLPNNDQFKIGQYIIKASK